MTPKLMTTNNAPFSEKLQKKIDTLKARRKKLKLGSVHFDGPLLLAPMSSICTPPFRLLMEDLGAGGTVSELISCHGINYKNKKTLDMLRVDPLEKNVGIQLFGEDKFKMAEAAKIAESMGPKFIDINMGCPVKKVVGTGAGSSLLKDLRTLPGYIREIKNAIQLPLSIKIRIGWDENSLNTPEVLNIAKGEGVEFVAIHGRTRAQQYTGKANWEYIEANAREKNLPIIGNGDLFDHLLISEKINLSQCNAFMLGRGPLRDPFLFLSPYMQRDENFFLTNLEYYEVFEKLFEYTSKYAMNERHLLITIRKHLIWMCAGFDHVNTFREEVYKTEKLDETMKIAKNFFYSQNRSYKKNINWDSFMNGGHG